MSDRRAYRSVTDDERNEMRLMRVQGMCDAAIARACCRAPSHIARLIGAAPQRRVAPTGKAASACKPGVPMAFGTRGQALVKDTIRTAWNDYALPPGHSATWGAISSEPFPAGL